MNCSSNVLNLGDLGGGISALIARYIAVHQPSAIREKLFFANMPSLELAIHHAAYSLDDREPPKRYSHQRRIRRSPMRKAHWYLSHSLAKLWEMRTFTELHKFLKATFSKIHGLGALYTYDTALRLGFFLRLEPVDVYLHAGTRQGARAIGIRASRIVKVNELPTELHVLAPHEIENFLCIFKPRKGGQ
ncbi:MAG: hypothetical protein AB7F79_02265 [Steroidobacteraceae bacterium]